MKVKENYQRANNNQFKERVGGYLFEGEKNPSMNDTLAKYSNMVKMLVHQHIQKSSHNAVCNAEDLYSEGMLAVYEALLSFDPTKETSRKTWVVNRVKWALLEFHKYNFYATSGGSYLHTVMKDNGLTEDSSFQDWIDAGVSKSVAKAAMYYKLQPSQYGAQLNLVDHNAKRMLNSLGGLSSELHNYLNDMECDALECYFGLNDKPRLSMRTIGVKYDKSRKAVSYMINKSLMKIRHIPGIEHYYFNSDNHEDVFRSYIKSEED